jgi:hypothetical protein
MIELKSREQLNKAIERAKKSRLYVRASQFFRQYKVENRENGQTYTVDFFLRNGRRFGQNLACKHLAAAAGLHVVRAAQAVSR